MDSDGESVNVEEVYSPLDAYDQTKDAAKARASEDPMDVERPGWVSGWETRDLSYRDFMNVDLELQKEIKIIDEGVVKEYKQDAASRRSGLSRRRS